MKCQCCGKNEIEQRLYINILGQAGDINLCASCIRRLRLYVAGMMEALRMDSPLPEDELSITGNGDESFLDDTQGNLRLRRRINELRRQMDAAVAAEDYESAAELRDALKQTGELRVEN